MISIFRKYILDYEENFSTEFKDKYKTFVIQVTGKKPKSDEIYSIVYNEIKSRCGSISKT